MSQRPGTPFDRPTDLRDLNPFDRRSPFEKDYDQMVEAKERRQKGDEARAKFKERVGSFIGGAIGSAGGAKAGAGRMAGEGMRTAFGGGAITGDSADRRAPTEEMVMGNPMAAPTAADFVKMPQDLQAGYMHLNRFGSPLPIHGLGTPGRTAMANNMQDQNFMAYHRAVISASDPVCMSEEPIGG